MRETLPRYAGGEIFPVPQTDEGATYAAKLEKSEGRLDFQNTAADLDRQVRALTPWPGAFMQVNDCRIKVISAEADPAQARDVPGTVVDDCLAVATSDGIFRPTRIQREGKGAMETDACLRGFPVAPGTVLTP